jgi:F420-dependent oxidoreductase-like protein
MTRNTRMELKLPAPSLLVLVGPSGSGKTTWAREHFSPGEIVSSDALRAMVGTGENDQSASTAAFEILERIVDERLRRGLTVVIDTLGYDDEARARWISKAHDSDMPAHAVTFDTPAEVCEQRNQARDKPIPKSVLKRQISRFAVVARNVASEPFDGVHAQQPIAVVAPGVVASAATDGRGPGSTGHSFGLIVSRMNWPEGSRGDQLAAIARRAEMAGFRDIWVMDHFRQIRGVGQPWEDLPESYTALGFIAGATSTIRLGALVSGITHRPPIVLGKMLASLDVLSGGRAICGLGAAWDEAEHAAFGIEYPDLKTRYALLEETLQMLPLLWGKGTPEFTGELIRSPELTCYPRPIQDPIPILIGGGGEKRTLRLVAQYGDACNVFGDPKRVRHKARVLAAHCEDVGRDPSEIEVTHLTKALASPDRRKLRERVDRLRGRNTTPEGFMDRHNAGTVDDLVGLFAAYQTAGADHSIVAIPDVSEDGSIETFGEVIAAFSD